MRFFVVIPDGASEKFDKNTALNIAHTPNLDSIAPKSFIALARTIPMNLPPGSDIGTLSIFGFDPVIYARGRAPFEIAAKKIVPPENSVIFRMNLVQVEKGIMKDHSGGHIKDQEAQKIIEKLRTELSDFLKKNNMEIFFGKSYRNYLVWKLEDSKRLEDILKTEFTPPHDILGQEISPHLEKYKAFPELLYLIEASCEILNGKQANMIWFWGQGKRTSLPEFEKIYGKKAYLVSAVDIVKGIAILSGVEVIDVPGITGYLDSNFEGKVEAILNHTGEGDVGFIHIEATDETGHEGDREKKKLAVEIVDKRVIGNLLKRSEGEEIRLLVIPDHPTPCEVRTHISDPVPFLIYPCPFCGGKKCSLCGRKRFTEIEALSTNILFDAKLIMKFFLST